VLKIGDQRGGAQALMQAAGELDNLPYTIEWAQFPAASPLLEALAAGAIDVGGVGGAPFAFAFAGGAKIKAVFAYRPEGADIGRASAIIVRKGSTIHALADLKGRKLATVRGSAGQDLALRLIEQAGLQPSDVQWTYLNNGEAKAALDSGAIDAWSTWGSYVGIAVLENDDRVLADASGLPTGVGFFAASDQAITGKRKILGDFLARLNRARRWATTHPDAYAQTLAKETGLPLKVARFSISAYLGSAQPINNALIDEQAQIFARYRRANIIPALPEIRGAYDPSFNAEIFPKRSAGDRHQFRFIVSAEDGAEYPDLKPYVRRLMAQVEQDLGTKLDWVAVDHFNAERPHTHIVLRGVDDRGDNLIIAREYISHGLRERASELVTLDLGPRTDREIEARLRHDVDQERLTAIDRRLLRRMDANRTVSPADNDPLQQSVTAGRLRKLRSMDLAEDIGGGRYRLADGMEETLRRMGERGDIIRVMQRELTARRLDRAGVERVIASELREPIVGKLISQGFSDEHRDRHYMMVDGIDGRVHYVEVGRGVAIPSVPEGAALRIEPTKAEATDADRTVDAVARANGGRYSVDLHLRHDAQASQAYAESHVRRLEAMRRAGAGPERQPDGSWAIPGDHLARAEA
jgi:aliphatic sulfonates family ABC transporter substrate-binding protein